MCLHVYVYVCMYVYLCVLHADESIGAPVPTEGKTLSNKASSPHALGNDGIDQIVRAHQEQAVYQRTLQPHWGKCLWHLTNEIYLTWPKGSTNSSSRD